MIPDVLSVVDSRKAIVTPQQGMATRVTKTRQAKSATMQALVQRGCHFLKLGNIAESGTLQSHRLNAPKTAMMQSPMPSTLMSTQIPPAMGLCDLLAGQRNSPSEPSLPKALHNATTPSMRTAKHITKPRNPTSEWRSLAAFRSHCSSAAFSSSPSGAKDDMAFVRGGTVPADSAAEGFIDATKRGAAKLRCGADMLRPLGVATGACCISLGMEDVLGLREDFESGIVSGGKDRPARPIILAWRRA
mmetsp:Transcript_52806/g.113072  ORF Transcript_52806/g.113072 Transcript_52806/m.113072 type:complete len:246 (-) Transcript_52806:47-784(-)